ncbi:MAG: ATP-binding protein, partial [Phycisphaerae bacterium]|nr:ATP-binding protein [Phycisphaerae bacterium]
MLISGKQYSMTKKLATDQITPQAYQVLQSLPAGVIVFDKKLKISNFNPGASILVDIQPGADATLAMGTNEKIWGNWRQVLLDVVQTGKVCRFDNVSCRTAAGQSVLQITCAPMRDFSTGSIEGGILLIENTTAKAAFQKQQAHTERLAVLGKLASKVAHELNNPIDGIMRYINLAKRTIGEPDQSKPLQYLDHATTGLKRMVQIITELLEFSRSKHSPIEDMALDKIIDDAIKFIEPSAKTAGVEIDRQYISGLPKIKSGNLFQVFCNLLKNAVEAMPNGGRVTITCNVAEDKSAVIQFRDTGPGFDQASSEAMFEPFFTTKTGGKGTGLGLAICRDIMEKCGGKITAKNAP